MYDILTLASIGINSTFKSHANGPRPIMKKNTNTIKPTKGTHPMSETVCSETFKDDSIRDPLSVVVEGARRVGWQSGQFSYILKNIPTATIERHTKKSEMISKGFLPNLSTISVCMILATI